MMFIIQKAKDWIAFRFSQDNYHSSHLLYRTLQPEYKYADCLSAVKCYSNRRLLSRFRSGCHGLRVDTRRWENNEPDTQVFFDKLLLCQTFWLGANQTYVVVPLGAGFPTGAIS